MVKLVPKLLQHRGACQQARLCANLGAIGALTTAHKTHKGYGLFVLRPWQSMRPWACLSDGLPSLGQEGGFMSYDQRSVPDFLEHYDGIPEVVLGGACNAPQRARKS